MNYIKDIFVDKENGITTFFLQTEGEDVFWYWQVDTTDIKEPRLQFVNNEENSLIGFSCWGFETLDDAKADALGRCNYVHTK